MTRRVLMLTTFYPPYSFGGDAIDVQLWAGALARRGSEVTVVHDEDAYTALGAEPHPDHRPEPDVEVIGLRSRTGRLGLLLTHQTGRPMIHGRTLARLCAERQFDTVVFGNVSLVGGPGVLSLCPSAVRVYMAMEHWLVCPTHALWRYDGRPCDERRCLRCTIYHRRPPQLWRYTGLLDRAARHVDLFVARSEFSRRKHLEFGFKSPMVVVPAFVAVPSQSAGPSPHSRPYFLFVGRVESLKGLDDVLPLFEADRGADLVIAGTGSREGELRKATSHLPNVRWLGYVPRQHLGAWYGHALALVVPSATYETFGLVIAEAFSHGTPVVARSRGPLPELLEWGGGLLFTTANELSAALRRLAEQPSVRADLSRQAYTAFLANWSEDAVVPRFLDIIEDVRAKRNLASQAALEADIARSPA